VATVGYLSRHGAQRRGRSVAAAGCRSGAPDSPVSGAKRRKCAQKGDTNPMRLSRAEVAAQKGWFKKIECCNSLGIIRSKKQMRNDIQTLGDLCLEGAGKYRSRKALEFCRGERLLETVNFRTLALRSGQMAGLVHSLGIRRGQRVMILSENRPEWVIAVFGLALAGAVSLPLPPEGGPVDRYRDMGEPGAVSAICVTRRTANLAAEMDPALPRIYLDSPSATPGKLSPWTSIAVSIGGITKQLPLPRSFRRTTDMPEAGETAVRWPGGTQYSHRELLALAGGGHPWPRLFPRDRLIALCSLAEPGALILGILAAVLGGASLSCVDTEDGDPGQGGTAVRGAELLRTVELLRPTVLLGDGGFLESVYADRAAPLAEGLLSRNFLTGPLARRLGGRRFIKSLGGNIRFYGIACGPPLSETTERRLGPIHLPRMRIPGDPLPAEL
jgi:long-chain acyl-CoA synthetase